MNNLFSSGFDKMIARENFRKKVYRKEARQSDYSLVKSFVKKEIEVDNKIYSYVTITTMDGSSYNSPGLSLHHFLFLPRIEIPITVKALNLLPICFHCFHYAYGTPRLIVRGKQKTLRATLHLAEKDYLEIKKYFY